MEQIPVILVALGLIILASLSGIIFLERHFRVWLGANLSRLVSFSAGVFIVIALHLFEESIEILDSAMFAGLSLLLGIMIFILLKLFLPESHHHSEDCHDHVHNRPRAIRMMIGDALHNIADGIIIIPAFMASTALGIITAIGIFVHELLQEVSEFFVLRDSGYTTRQALYRNFLVSLTILVGGAIGLYFAQNKVILGILLGMSAGSFLYLVAVDLFPYKKLRYGASSAIFHILFFLLGVGFVYILNLLFAH